MRKDEKTLHLTASQLDLMCGNLVEKTPSCGPEPSSHSSCLAQKWGLPGLPGYPHFFGSVWWFWSFSLGKWCLGNWGVACFQKTTQLMPKHLIFHPDGTILMHKRKHQQKALSSFFQTWKARDFSNFWVLSPNWLRSISFFCITRRVKGRTGGLLAHLLLFRRNSSLKTGISIHSKRNPVSLTGHLWRFASYLHRRKTSPGTCKKSDPR